MPEFYKRTLFGAIYVAVVIGLLIWGYQGLCILAIGVSSVCIYECLKLRNSHSAYILIPALLLNLAILSLVLTVLPFHWKFEIFEIVFIAVISIMLGSVWIILRKYKLEAGHHMANLVFSIAYISIPFALLLFRPEIMQRHYNFQYPLLIFILVWTSDTCAYIAGKIMGRRPLFPEVSPGKTVEGFIGGTLLSAGIGALLSLWFNFITPLDGIILGMLVSCSGTLGDLFESSLKRKAGVKDSGNVIPGHGGLLDRFDAFIFAVPVVFMYFVIASKF